MAFIYYLNYPTTWQFWVIQLVWMPIVFGLFATFPRSD